MESQQKITRRIGGPSAIGDIGEKYACEYLKEEGVTVAALGSLIYDGHAGHVREYLFSAKLWDHLNDDQIRFIFTPNYPASGWKYYSDINRTRRWPSERTDYTDYKDPDECLERIRQGHYEPGEEIPFGLVSWDFVGWPKNGKGAYLFEVKTASPGKTPGIFRPERDMWKPTGMEPFELRKLDRIGFIPYLVQVQLTDDDSPNISVNDIPIP